MAPCNMRCLFIPGLFFFWLGLVAAEKRDERKHGNFNDVFPELKKSPTTRSSIVINNLPVLKTNKHNDETSHLNSVNNLNQIFSNHGWLYEYTYSKDGCNDADLISSRSVMTNVCLSDKDEAGTLSNNDGESYGSIMYTCENGESNIDK